MDSKKIAGFIGFAVLVMLFDWLLEFIFCTFFSHSPFTIKPISNVVIPLVLGLVVGFFTILRRP